ncbi:AbrB/MazE/SpoVT family DNA-binding domain-containing protein [Candidatus Calescamantes bacterium]|nr:AbrB/MazE/SpoVT family DNA-binding domain-containing protein [Candidatus Calescamantes bacterium]
MKTAVTKRGQTVIPAPLRKKYGINQNTWLQWLDTGEGIKVEPIPRDVITALRGMGKGKKLVERIIKERKFDAERE